MNFFSSFFLSPFLSPCSLFPFLSAFRLQIKVVSEEAFPASLAQTVIQKYGRLNWQMIS